VLPDKRTKEKEIVDEFHAMEEKKGPQISSLEHLRILRKMQHR